MMLQQKEADVLVSHPLEIKGLQSIHVHIKQAQLTLH